MKLFYWLVAPVSIITGILIGAAFCGFYELTYWLKIDKAAAKRNM